MEGKENTNGSFVFEEFMSYNLNDQEKFFLKKAEEAAHFFQAIEKNKTIRIISHLDADGISAAAILIKLLNRTNRRYSISILQQLSEEKLKALKKERYGVFVFTDIGSGQLKYINEYLSDRKVIILDHHVPDDYFLKWKINDNIFHYNPHIAGIDGNECISGAGVVYLFAKEVESKNKDMAHIAIVGAIGDMQEDYGFKSLNRLILKDAIEAQKIKVINGIRIFGAQTRPLHKLLQYSTDPYIPGVSGSESGAIAFLRKIGINPKNKNGEWVKLIDLSREKIKKLVAGLIMMRIEEGFENAHKIIGPIYILREEKKASPLRDANEFSTLLNACGRMRMASLGIGSCLGDSDVKKKALNTLKNYKKAILEALRWYEDNSNNEHKIKKGDGFIIINGGEDIRSSLIGTLCSIISKSKIERNIKFIMGLARNDDGETTKISIRKTTGNETDVREVMRRICEGVKAEVGGHKNAAGALIKSKDEEKVINNAEKVLARMAIEEQMEL